MKRRAPAGKAAPSAGPEVSTAAKASPVAQAPPVAKASPVAKAPPAASAPPAANASPVAQAPPVAKAPPIVAAPSETRTPTAAPSLQGVESWQTFGESRWRSATWALAAVLHLGIPLVAAMAPLSARLLEARSSGAGHRDEIDIESMPVERPRVQPAESAPGAEAAPQEQRPMAMAAAGATRVEGAPAAEAPAGEAPAAPQPGVVPSPEDWSGPPSGGPDGVLVPGVNGAPVWAIPGAVNVPQRPPSAPAPTTAGTVRPTDKDIAGKILRGEQAAKDKALGLDLPAAGTVAAALASAVRTTATPSTGRATYEVRLGPGGQVLSLRMVSSSGGAQDAWAEAGRMAAGNLARKKLVMSGAFAGGAVVMVDVASHLQLPAGGGSKFGSPAVKPGPPPGTAGGGFTFDLSNVGAHPTRVVTSSFRTTPVK